MVATREIGVEVSAYFTVTIYDNAPADLFLRGQDPEWGEPLYGTMSEDDIIHHWAHNAVANGVESVHRLDGWADVPPYAVSFSVDEVEVQR